MKEKTLSEKKFPLKECPFCGRGFLECVQWKNDKSFFQFLCRGCLIYIDLKKYEMDEEDIRELASE